jgi:hypothetical protein
MSLQAACCAFLVAFACCVGCQAARVLPPAQGETPAAVKRKGLIPSPAFLVEDADAFFKPDGSSGDK